MAAVPPESQLGPRPGPTSVTVVVGTEDVVRPVGDEGPGTVAETSTPGPEVVPIPDRRVLTGDRYWRVSDVPDSRPPSTPDTLVVSYTHRGVGRCG